MKGAIIGDIVGSIYEFDNIKTTEFEFLSPECYITDDTVMTVATAKALLDVEDPENAPDCVLEAAFLRNYLYYGRRYPDMGYGGAFRRWLNADFPKPYYSCGNGSAMRVSPVAFVATSLESAVRMARLSARVSHNHPDGVAGAEATAGAVWLAHNGASLDAIVEFVRRYYRSTTSLPSLEHIRDIYSFDHFAATCAGTVPFAVKCFKEARGDFEQTIRYIVSIGGDTDTLGAIGGAIAEAYDYVPDDMWETVADTYLPRELSNIVDEFYGKYGR